MTEDKKTTRTVSLRALTKDELAEIQRERREKRAREEEARTLFPTCLQITGAMGERVEVIRTKGWVMQSQPAGVGINRATEITLSKMHGKIIDTQQIQTQGVDVDRLEALKVALDAGADDPDCQKIVLKLRDDPPTGNE